MTAHPKAQTPASLTPARPTRAPLDPARLAAARLAPVRLAAVRLAPSGLALISLLLVAGCASRPEGAPAARPMPAELSPQAAAAPPSPLSLNTPIEAICATPAGKAVLDRDLPGLTGRPEFDMFKAMTLKQLQPMSRGRITSADLAKVQADLAALNDR